MDKNQLILELIKEYNEEIHVGSGLEREDLYTLDESEVDKFLNWIVQNL